MELSDSDEGQNDQPRRMEERVVTENTRNADEGSMLISLSDNSMTMAAGSSSGRDRAGRRDEQGALINSEPLIQDRPDVRPNSSRRKDNRAELSSRTHNAKETRACGVVTKPKQLAKDDTVKHSRTAQQTPIDDPNRLVFREKKKQRPAQPARSHWGLYYFMFQMQNKQRSTWDLSSLSEMALHPKISRSAASSIWEIGWQEMTDDEQLPDVTAGFDYQDTENMLSLWWASHLWATELDSEGRSDLALASANIGPTGIWPSLRTTLKEMVSNRPGIILLQDLRISRRSFASLRATLAFLYPQYHVTLTSHSRSEWEDGTGGRRRNKYNYACATLLHRHLYTTITTESICRAKNKQERASVLGHVLVVSAYCKSLQRKVVILNLYQHTAMYPHRQKILYECLERYLNKIDRTEVSIIGAGYLNAAFPGQ